MPSQNAEKIKETFKDVKEEIKEGGKKIFPWAIVITLILVIVLLLTGLRLKISIQDNVAISIDPAEKSFRVLNTQNQIVSFITRVKGNTLCNVKCAYEFIDHSSDQTLDKGNLTIGRKFTFNRTYLLPANQVGSGQKIYNFEVQCHNIQGGLCKTKNITRRRTSFITLSYDLSSEEASTRDTLKVQLTRALAEINEGGAIVQKLQSIIAAPHLIQRNVTSKKVRNLSNKLLLQIQSAEQILALWELERYSDINVRFPDFSNRTNALLIQSNLLQNLVLSQIDEQNALISGFNQNLTYLSSLRNLSLTTFNGAMPEALNIEFTLPLNTAIALRESLLNQSITSATQLTLQFISFSTQLESLSTKINVQKMNLERERLNLTRNEMRKSCLLGNCTSTNSSSCSTLAHIIQIHNSTRYPITNATANFTEPFINYTPQGIHIVTNDETTQHYKRFCVLGKIDSTTLSLPYIEPIEILHINITPLLTNVLKKNPPLCCVHMQCQPCCNDSTCQTDPSLYPVLLIHGHSLIRQTSPEPLLDNFNQILYQLQEDGYLNAGIIQFDQTTSSGNDSYWGLANFPVAMKASYYYDYYYALGDYFYITNSAENIDTYAIRLNSIIKTALRRTAKPKVNIVAHSMGGLVVRRYLQIFGEDHVDKLVYIGTPNKGIIGDTKFFCRLMGDKRECEDMYEQSIFLKKLNDPNNQPIRVQQHIIFGKGCKTSGQDGDGIITIDSAQLPDAESYPIDGTCNDSFKKDLHSALLDIDLYPAVYNRIHSILQPKNPLTQNKKSRSE